MDTNHSQGLEAEVRQTAQPALLIRSVHRIYQERFWRWFGIMVPASLLAGLVVTLAEQRVRAIFSSIPRGQAAQHYLDILAGNAIRFGSFFVSWLLGCFALAAIASVISGFDAREEQADWAHDSYQRAREHFGPIAVTAFITLWAFTLCGVIFGIFEIAALRALFGRSVYRHSLALRLLGYVFVGSAISWLGASIPLVLRDDVTVWAALKKSMKLSRGYQGALFLLVVESVAGSCIAWYGVVHGLPLLVPHGWQYPVWYGWLVRLVALLASAAVEPPLFIGFSFLADPQRFQSSI